MDSNVKRVAKALDDFEEFMESHSEFIFDIGEENSHTYEVVLKGLSYTDAKNAAEIGFEYGRETIIRMEGDENGNN